jgi:hypothetical protein
VAVRAAARGELDARAIVRAIATAHGAISEASSDERMKRFRIVWPRALPEETPGRP